MGIVQRATQRARILLTDNIQSGGIFGREIQFFFLPIVFGENKTKNRIIGFSYLFKTPEQTSPVRRSLAVQEADCKSKAVHRLSELVTIKSFEAMRACALFKRFYYLP